jgi:hypothetical protein
MSALAIIAIVIGVAIVLLIALGFAHRTRKVQQENRRELSGAHREEGRTRHAEAAREQAAADEAAVRARREAAEAQLRAERAAGERDA